MSLNAFEDGQTILNSANMNGLMSGQPWALIMDGDQADAKTGAGVFANDCSTAFIIARFTLTGQTTIGRVELDLSAAGAGQDLTIEIRDSAFSPNGSNDGVLLKSVTIPKKILPAAQGYLSIPIDLTGLTAGATYWLRINKIGDAVNHFHWHGEASQDASYPAYYRSGTTGAWTANNALHFKIYAETPGTETLMHAIIGTNDVTTIIYSAPDVISKIYHWCPGPSGVFVISEIATPTLDANGIPVKGVMS